MVRSRTCRMEMWSGTSFVEIGACSCQEISEIHLQARHPDIAIQEPSIEIPCSPYLAVHPPYVFRYFLTPASNLITQHPTSQLQHPYPPLTMCRSVNTLHT